jgi:hypothetical protein
MSSSFCLLENLDDLGFGKDGSAVIVFFIRTRGIGE